MHICWTKLKIFAFKKTFMGQFMPDFVADFKFSKPFQYFPIQAYWI